MPLKSGGFYIQYVVCVCVCVGITQAQTAALEFKY